MAGMSGAGWGPTQVTGFVGGFVSKENLWLSRAARRTVYVPPCCFWSLPALVLLLQSTIKREAINKESSLHWCTDLRNDRTEIMDTIPGVVKPLAENLVVSKTCPYGGTVRGSARAR